VATVELMLAWFTDADRSEWVESAAALLSEAERQHIAAISGTAVRAQHAIGRAMIRLIGAQAGGCLPHRVAVAVSDAGKPRLADLPDLHVSVAHTGGVVVAAACRHTAVGVDVERDPTATKDPRRIARRFFNETEAAALRDLPEDQAADWFSSAWTIKEAVGKALGVGMVPALSGAVVEGEVGGLALKSVWSGPPADRWTIHQLRAPNGNEKIAVALPAPNIALGSVSPLTIEDFARATRS
jgi:4'-phosphopantetheinyl transferase